MDALRRHYGRAAFTCCTFVFVIGAREAFGQTVYDFSTNAGVDRFAFENSFLKSPIPKLANSVPSTEFTASQYTTVSFSDDSRHTTGAVGGNNRAAARFVFMVSEPASTITQLDVLWEGGDNTGTDIIEVWLWNAARVAYEQVGTTTALVPPDGIVSASFTISPSNYVGAANAVTLFVFNHGNKKELLTDYVSITITVASCTVDADCNDGNGCTVDACVSGLCLFSIEPAGTECRASAGACDPAEVCDGVSAVCPADVLDLAGTVCRASTDLCDAAEVCDGLSAACPLDVLKPAGTECRASTGACDPAEVCDGFTVACPVDALEPAGTPCSDGLFCNGLETCDGFGVCLPGSDPCSDDLCNETTDTCDECQADVDCDDGNGCTAYACVGGVCQNTIEPVGTVCRASTDLCDMAEVCDGVSGACPADALEPAGTVCRASTGPDDPVEVCDGVTAACPADEFLPEAPPVSGGGGGVTAPKPVDNQAPVANAGPDQNVEPGTEVFLSAQESFDPDGDALRYAWVQISQPLVADGYDLPFPELSWSFIAPEVPSTTSYEFELTVTDSGTPSLSATDRVVITVAVEPNQPPVAVAGPNQSVLPSESVVLSGEASYDPDDDLPLTFLWAQTGGPPVMDEPIEAEAIVFEAPTVDETTTLTFELTVTDHGHPPLSSHTTVEVTVVPNMPPATVAGADQDEDLPLEEEQSAEGGFEDSKSEEPTITRQGAPPLCGVGLPLVLGAMSFVMLVSTRRGREVVRCAARMLVQWVADARRGRTFDRHALGKRRRPRWSWSKEVVVRLDERRNPVRVPTADISESGISIWFPEPLKVGQYLQLGDRIGDAWLHGRVVHVADKPDEQGMYRMGIQFIDEDSSALADDPDIA